MAWKTTISDPPDLVQRMEKLEKANRRLKLAGVLVLTLVGCLLLLGVASPKRTVEAEAFILRDANGEMRAVLGMGVEGPSLSLYDANEVPRAVLLVLEGEPALFLYDANGKVIFGASDTKRKAAQRAASSRFEKYEVPAEVSVMDMVLLEANLLIIRDKLGSAPGITLPRLSYDWSRRKVKAIAQVDEKFLGEQKIDEVKKNLNITALTASLAAGLGLPEMRYADPDFEVEFLSVGKEKRTVYAEYKNGKLTIH